MRRRDLLWGALIGPAMYLSMPVYGQAKKESPDKPILIEDVPADGKPHNIIPAEGEKSARLEMLPYWGYQQFEDAPTHRLLSETKCWVCAYHIVHKDASENDSRSVSIIFDKAPKNGESRRSALILLVGDAYTVRNKFNDLLRIGRDWRSREDTAADVVATEPVTGFAANIRRFEGTKKIQVSLTYDDIDFIFADLSDFAAMTRQFDNALRWVQTDGVTS